VLVRGDISRFVIIGQCVGAVSAHDRPLVADAGPILAAVLLAIAAFEIGSHLACGRLMRSGIARISADVQRPHRPGARIGWLLPVLGPFATYCIATPIRSLKGHSGS
jgi:hypothetical protein